MCLESTVEIISIIYVNIHSSNGFRLPFELCVFLDSFINLPQYGNEKHIYSTFDKRVKFSSLFVLDYFNPPKVASGSELRRISFCRLYFPHKIPLSTDLSGGGKILLIFDKFFLFFTNILSIFIVTNDKNGRSACKRFQKSRNYITPAQETPRRTLRFRPAGTLHGSTGNTPKQKQRTKSTTIKKRDHSLSI